MARRTGFVFDEKYLWWDTGTAALHLPPNGKNWVEPDSHVESAASKRRFKSLLDASGLGARLTSITPRPATVDEVARVHDRAYIAAMQALSDDRGGDAGDGVPFGPGGYEVALLAAGGTITAIDAVLDGTVDNCYALVRPPGHHAEHALGRGFCMFGNCAIGVEHARQARGLRRVAVVDWDVHHGNGTQKAFYGDPDVLTISLHQYRNYPPESGYAEENGEGAGEGANINVPLPPGSGTGAYIDAFERVVAPALRRHRPELIIVASGLDASIHDPLARQMMTSSGYRRLTQIMLSVADDVCSGRLVASHEGGYSPVYVAFCGLAVVEELSGIASGVSDPFLEHGDGTGMQELQPHQQAMIDASAALVEKVPSG